MGWPTFDFRNAVRFLSLTRHGVHVWFNPTRTFLTFAIALGVIAGTVVQFFDSLQIPRIAPSFDLAFANSDLAQLVGYCLAADVFVDLLNFFLAFLNSFIPFSVTLTVSFFSAVFIWRMSSAFRAWMTQTFG